MLLDFIGFILLGVAMIAANLPWLSNRLFAVLPMRWHSKPVWLRLFEWWCFYFIVLLVGFGVERKLNGHIHEQSWVFAVTTILLFVICAVPGVVYRYSFKAYYRRYLKQRSL